MPRYIRILNQDIRMRLNLVRHHDLRLTIFIQQLALTNSVLPVECSADSEWLLEQKKQVNASDKRSLGGFPGMLRQPVLAGWAGDKAHHGVSQGHNSDIGRAIREDRSNARSEHHPLRERRRD